MLIRVDGKIFSYKAPILGRNKILYTPKEIKEYKQYIGFVAKSYMQSHGIEKISGAVYIDIEAYFKIPKSYTKSKIKKIEENEYVHTVYPDATNILKLVEDALKNLCFDDDNKCCSVSTKKFWTSSEPYLLIYLEKCDVVQSKI